MSFADRFARMNRAFANPVMRLWAGRVPPLAIVEHVGRKSGRKYRTPVTAFRIEGGFVVALPYGRDRDWVRNLTAAGGGVLVRLGKPLVIAKSTVVPSDEASTFLSRRAVRALKWNKIDYVLRLET
ncbi:nitroreductase family deazaflavin-dependent oxidoreductase [Amycolatopsis sp. H20-H5]|uniref:nitroreductase family deazaflavin-dependent oxidoreductase n=1 Tax=Amycolatopsis sp. H20-H5 TaxID=3046309 RepID=UPI002DB89D04|nr:nitroreductase family deazaflavin-dependent oxidoreductase [Amycolatopsis sp. H20-H5]MEC3975601.1 nitroreductase family deazaflavin-dependent oxidoreductase [Amycolatopsis sp. H20-H5]